MPETVPPVIEITDLWVEYKTPGRRLTAVSGLNLSIDKGEVVGFIGPNGAGKTTTIKVLIGFLSPTRGQVRVFGERAGGIEARRRMGYLPEVALYYPFLTAREALRLYARLADIPPDGREETISALLGRVGLTGREDESLRTFSKGMLQRVGIAQAIMGAPDLLILDEITSGLDPVARHDVRKLLLEFKARGKTVFFSSHELSEVTLLCDRVILIDAGKVIEERSLDTLMDLIQRYVTVAEIESLPDSLPEGVFLQSVQGKRYSFVAESPKGQTELATMLEGLDARVVSTGQEAGSLEDYFVRTIGHKIT